MVTQTEWEGERDRLVWTQGGREGGEGNRLDGDRHVLHRHVAWRGRGGGEGEGEGMGGEGEKRRGIRLVRAAGLGFRLTKFIG